MGKYYLTNSEITTWQRDQWQWYVTYFLKKGRPGDPESNVAQGTRFHSLAEAAFKSGGNSSAVHAAANELYVGREEERNWALKRSDSLFEELIHQDVYYPGDPVNTEVVLTSPKPVFVSGSNFYLVRGKVDVVLNYSLIDIKTTGTMSGSLKHPWQADSQLRTYLWLWNQLHPADQRSVGMYALVNKGSVTKKSPEVVVRDTTMFTIDADVNHYHQLKASASAINDARYWLEFKGYPMHRVLQHHVDPTSYKTGILSHWYSEIMEADDPHDIIQHILKDAGYEDIDPMERYNK